jgi:hypothetical protein
MRSTESGCCANLRVGAAIEKYDRIPDAYAKEQELMRRLGTQQNTSL